MGANTQSSPAGNLAPASTKEFGPLAITLWTRTSEKHDAAWAKGPAMLCNMSPTEFPGGGGAQHKSTTSPQTWPRQASRKEVNKLLSSTLSF